MTRLLSIAALAAIAVAGYLFWSGNTAPRDQLSLAAIAQSAEGEEIDTSIVAEMSMGNPDASVTVVEYASFTCPHCRNFHEESFGTLKADYIDAGKINFIYREVYFDRFGLWAGMLARCGGEDRYFGLVSLLYENQRDWAAGGDPTVIAGNLKRLGRTAGLEDAQVDACLQDAVMARAMVALYQENATRDGVRSTPSFLVNGELVSGNDWGALKAAIDEAIGG